MNQELAAIGHNYLDPLEAEIRTTVSTFRSQFTDRREEIAHCQVTNLDQAGRATALAGILASIVSNAETRRIELKEPYLEGGRKIDVAFKALKDDISKAKAAVVQHIDAWRKEQEAIAEAAAEKLRAEAAEKERLAQKAAEEGNLLAAARLERAAAAASATAAIPMPTGPIRSLYGQTASAQKVWRFEITDRSKIPQHILSHPKVIEAMESVIGTLVRSGTREIAGCRIWMDSETRVRK